MKVFFVGAGPGDPDLLTVKARRLLETASGCIYAGSLISPAILSLLPPTAARHDSSRLDLDAIIALYAEAQRRAEDVIRLHSGESALYGATGEQMRRLMALGIAYEVVPGISAFQAAAAALKTELTAPEVAQTVIITRAAGRTPLPPEQELGRLAASRATLCIYLSTPRVREIVATLTPHYGPACPAAVVYHASWPDQLIVRGDLRGLAAQVEAAGLHKTAIILVGYALGDTAAVSKLYDRAFSHEYRQGADA